MKTIACSTSLARFQTCFHGPKNTCVKFPVSIRLRRRLHATGASQQPKTVEATTEAPVEEKKRELYEGGDALHSGHLPVSHGHTIYYEVHGKDDGPAAIFLHGGPGAGCTARHARFFDPQFWRVVLMDQRGCGRSQPEASLDGNTTQGIVEDMECLREHLSISEWLVLGGSWGVTLGLAYAITHPSRVSGLVLRGICTMRPQEINWMFRGGAGPLFPQGWEAFLSILSEDELQDPLKSYHSRLTSSNPKIQQEAASYWRGWEMNVMFSGGLTEVLVCHNGKIESPSGDFQRFRNSSKLKPDNKSSESSEDSGSEKSDPSKITKSIAQPLFECHYSVNGAFLVANEILDGIDRIRDIPCIGVQGRLDFVCPVQTAYDLSVAWPEMELRVIPGAGHSMYDSAILHELVEATDRMKSLHHIPIS